MKLGIVICSTRPGRVGPAIGAWVRAAAEKDEHFQAVTLDLAEFDLPVFDEPHHPRLRNYTKDHTKAWSAAVEACDAFVFVTPEYNYGPPPSLVNAMNYLVFEWHNKVAAFVSYGGQSGGLRAVQVAKLMLTSFKIMPLPEGVAIPMFAQQLDAERAFAANEGQDKAAEAMFAELARWAKALKAMRA